jgi:hypothetical protein
MRAIPAWRWDSARERVSFETGAVILGIVKEIVCDKKKTEVCCGGSKVLAVSSYLYVWRSRYGSDGVWLVGSVWIAVYNQAMKKSGGSTDAMDR